MEQKYYDAYRKNLVISFNDGVENIVKNPDVKKFDESMLGMFVANDIKDTSDGWKQNFNTLNAGFKKHGKKFMSQQEWNQFVDSVAMETRDKYLKF